MKYLLLSLLFYTQLFAFDAKMKAISYSNDYGKVKLMVTSPMLGKDGAKALKINIDYITNIKVKADDKLIYNANLTPCLAENPLMKFSYKDIKPPSLTLEYTDNDGTIRTNTKKVNHSNYTKPIPQYIKLSKNPKSYPNKIESIKKLFGNITLIEDGIQLTTPEYADFPGSVPMTINSEMKFKSISLFIKRKSEPNYSSFSSYTLMPSSSCGRDNEYQLISQWFGTPYSLVNFNLRIKLPYGIVDVLAVLEAENGKFYATSKQVKVNIGCVNSGG